MERRKREPQLEQAQDHLVRKIFSRFRRERSVAAAPAPAPRPAPAAPAPDPERGDPAPSAAPPAAPAAARGKWGRLLATGSLDAGGAAEPPRGAFTRSLSARDRPPAAPDAAPPAAPAPAPALPAASALSLKATFAKGRSASGASSRQDTIEEELEERRPAAAPPPPQPAPPQAAPPPPQATPPAPLPSLQAAHASHDAALAELRRDVRNEVQRLQQKLGRVEELLTMLATRLGAEPDGAAHSTPTEPDRLDVRPDARPADAARKRRSKVGLTLSAPY
ncbi:unnamed protein product [Spodoptera littoralis]|uniref:Uncharacterized protein n=1 Tax=Spodoptera littoralis TaxID=7109 RepID=A0A9P0HY60_SPOLI|nr:unnamed protein product [Spodoptera littoralis]